MTTRIKDGRCDYVTSELIEAGAPEETAYEAKPHIGTDKLKTVVKNIRNKITDLGGEIRFESKLTKIGILGGVVNYAEVNGDSKIETDNVILAIGHSARDTFEMLNDIGRQNGEKTICRRRKNRTQTGKYKYGSVWLFCR